MIEVVYALWRRDMIKFLRDRRQLITSLTRPFLWLLAFGFVIIAIYLAISLKYGEVAGRNPWGSRGYEWDVPSPPPTENFDAVPVFTRGPHEYQDVPEELAKVGHAI